MNSLTLALTVSIINYFYAAFIYLSVFDWFPWFEPSGMQFIVHLIVTGPATVLTTVWLFFTCKAHGFSQAIWLVNSSGGSIPLMSNQSGPVLHLLAPFGAIFSITLSVAMSFMLWLEFKND